MDKVALLLVDVKVGRVPGGRSSMVGLWPGYESTLLRLSIVWRDILMAGKHPVGLWIA